MGRLTAEQIAGQRLMVGFDGLSLTDDDVFQPYFEEVSSQAWPETETKTKASL